MKKSVHHFQAFVRPALQNTMQAYGSGSTITQVPGDVAATAVGLVYSLVDSGSNLTATDPAYGLHRAASLRLGQWEENGTNGLLLQLLTASAE